MKALCALNDTTVIGQYIFDENILNEKSYFAPLNNKFRLLLVQFSNKQNFSAKGSFPSGYWMGICSSWIETGGGTSLFSCPKVIVQGNYIF